MNLFVEFRTPSINLQTKMNTYQDLFTYERMEIMPYSNGTQQYFHCTMLRDMGNSRKGDTYPEIFIYTQIHMYNGEEEINI